VYVVTAPPGNVADTKRNRPYGRRRDVQRFLVSGDYGHVQRYHAQWLVLRRWQLVKLRRLGFETKSVYHDAHFYLFKLPKSLTSG
jgi:hypothetical protein